MKVKEKIVIQRKPRMSGITAAAARLGVSRYQIYAVTRGLRRPSARQVRMIPSFLQVSW